MKFIEDARHLWLRLWSVRLALLSALLSAAEVAVPYLAPAAPSHLFAILAGCVALAAAVARIVAQPALYVEADRD